MGFDVQIRRVEPSIRRTERVLLPLENRYVNVGNPNIPPQTVGGLSNYTGGVTREGKYISMPLHRDAGDMGEWIDAVKHEISHTFGLDDKKAEGDPTGRYYVRAGITDYGMLERLRGGRSVSDLLEERRRFGRPVRGLDEATISNNNVQMILRFVHEYNPAVHDRTNTSTYIRDTPRISITGVVGGVPRDFHTFDEMSSFYVHQRDFETRALRDIENLDAPGNKMVDDFMSRHP